MMKRMLFLSLAMIAGPGLARDITITDVSVHRGPGNEPEPIMIRVSGGRILAAGRQVDASGSEVYAGKGGYVTPGFIDSGSTLGIEEVGLSTRAADQRYTGQDMGAAFNPALAFNHNTASMASALHEGMTRVFLKPEPGNDVFAGQGALMALSGSSVSTDTRALYAYLGEAGRDLAGESRAAALQRLMLGLEEGRLFNDRRSAYESNRLRPLSFPFRDLEVLASVIRREKKLALYIDRASEIESALAALDKFNVDIVLYGAREAWKVTGAIKSRNIPVVLNALDNLPSSFDRLGARLDQPRLLHDAGILFALMTEDIYTGSRMLSQAAGVAVAYGLPWQAALDAVTVNPAKIWGLADRLGKLQAGDEATLVIWDGDPFEVTSQATATMIAGEFVALTDRQRMLRDRYRDLKGKTPFPYR